MRGSLLFLIVLVGVLGGACGGSADPCEGVTGTCVPVPSGTSGEDIDAIFNDAQPDTIIAFGEGTFELATDLQLTAAGITLQGQGMDATILSFAEQATGAQGILVTGDRFTAQDLAIEDTAGDGLKIEGVDGVSLLRVRAQWNGPPSSENGAYGLYPVQCGQVRIEGSRVVGASDAGVYVGQSHDIIVTGNSVEGNVAGIEIENSTRADVYGNTATGNTGGVLVFNLPGLPVGNGSITRVYDNTVTANNLDNFAPAGNIVGKIPPGTGIVVLAASHVEIFGNTITDHDAAALAVVSYIPIDPEPSDPAYDPFPTAVYAHDNVITGVADRPTGELGALLILAVDEYSDPPIVVPDQIWDGVVDPARATTGGAYPPDLKICFKNNGDADFLNIQFPILEGDPADTDASVADCTLPPEPGVSL